MVGVGSWQPGESTVYDASDSRTRRTAERQHVAGEVSGILLDSDGRPIDTDLAGRTIGISAAELRAVPEVIAIAYHAARADAVRAAVRGGMVNSLVTHRALALALLGDA